MKELALSTLFLLPETPDQIKSFVESAKEEVLNGLIDPKKLIVQMKIISDTLEAIKDDKDIKKCLSDEIEKYGKEGAGFGDFKITQEQRRTFNYDQTGDAMVVKFQDEASKASEQLKARQKFLQMLSKPLADPETGELIYPAACTVTTFFKVSSVKRITQ